jgi:hypothetical protein
MALNASSKNTIGFIVHSGCSDYMVPAKYDLQNQSQIEITVKVANGKLSQSKSVGSFHGTLFDGPKIRINKVYLFEELDKPLLLASS